MTNEIADNAGGGDGQTEISDGTWDMGRVGQREWSISLDEGKLPDWVKLRIKHNAALNGHERAGLTGKQLNRMMKLIEYRDLETIDGFGANETVQETLARHTLHAETLAGLSVLLGSCFRNCARNPR